jgi:hypothetical protein
VASGAGALGVEDLEGRLEIGVAVSDQDGLGSLLRLREEVLPELAVRKAGIRP